MRILTLDIENLASFRGKVRIDFEKGLGGEDLFAINGPTGSGKSTLLAAIGLALYGSHYKSGLIQKDLVSLGAPHGKVSLKFEQKGKQYTANWYCKVLKKSGEPLKTITPQRELFCDDLPCDETIEDILGLTFEQFGKTVVLNQGQFARFLTATFKERREILDKLWKGEDLAILSDGLALKVKELKNSCDNLKVQLESIDGVDPGQKKRMTASLEVTSGSHDLLKQQHDVFSTILSGLEQVIKNLTDQKRIEEKIIKLEKEQEDFSAVYRQSCQRRDEQVKLLSNHEKMTNERVPVLEKAKSLLEGISWSKNALAEVKKETSDISEKIRGIAAKRASLQIKINDYRVAIEKAANSGEEEINSEGWSEHLSRLAGMEGVLKSIAHTEESLSHQYQRQKELFKETSDVSSELGDRRRWWKEIAKRYVRNDKEISEDQRRELLLNVENVSNDKKTRLAGLQSEKVRYDDILKQITRHEKTLISTSDGLLKREKELEILALEQAHLVELLEKEETIHQMVREKQLLQGLIDQSRKDDSCILCGSSPFSEIRHPEVEENSNNNERLEELKDKLELCREKLGRLKAKQDIESGVVRETKVELSALKETSQELQKRTPELQSAELLHKLIEKLEEEKTGADQDYLKLQSLVSEIFKMLERKEELSMQLERSKQASSDILNKKDTLIEDFNKLREVLSNLIDVPGLDTLKRDGPEFIATTKKRWEDLATTNRELESCIAEGRHLDSLLKTNREQLGRHEQKIADLNLRLTQKEADYVELQVEGDPATEIDEIKKNGVTFRTNLDEITRTVHANKEKLASLDSFLKSYKTQIEDLKDLKKVEWDCINKNLAEKTRFDLWTPTLLQEEAGNWSRIQKACHSLLSWDQGETDEKTMEILQSLREELLETIQSGIEPVLEQWRKDKERLDYQLEDARAKESRAAQVRKRLESEQKEYFRLNTLFYILGRNDFRNYALSLLEEKLIELANKELSQLCEGRYELLQKTGKHGTDFYIRDMWSLAEERKVHTLSGGETFLLSLALAMALAEMSRGRTNIDCFFIDEGFGTLDKDSVGEALETLLRVQSQGKQIGIITHVKELTDQIPVNLTLEKENTGRSTVHWNYH